MIFLMRMDLKLGLGKMASQIANATFAAYKRIE
jgi:peptidyl-tRNA hydrolase